MKKRNIPNKATPGEPETLHTQMNTHSARSKIIEIDVGYAHTERQGDHLHT